MKKLLLVISAIALIAIAGSLWWLAIGNRGDFKTKQVQLGGDSV